MTTLVIAGLILVGLILVGLCVLTWLGGRR